MAERTADLGRNNEQLIQEIGERKRTEEALRETGDYLENLFNYANAPVIVWDSYFRVTRFNHAFERLTGLNSEEVSVNHLVFCFLITAEMRRSGL